MMMTTTLYCVLKTYSNISEEIIRYLLISDIDSVEQKIFIAHNFFRHAIQVIKVFTIKSTQLGIKQYV